MAEINAEVREDKPAAAKPDAGLALDDDDNVAEFMEVLAFSLGLCRAGSCSARTDGSCSGGALQKGVRTCLLL